MIYLHAVTYSAIGRAVAIALATLVVFGLVFLREATSPSGEGYWTAMAAAPGGDLYLADEGRRELLLVHSAGGWTRLAATPAGIYRALAADGANLLLATEGKLYQSNDRGDHWRAVLDGRFTAVAIHGSEELAGAWADALYVSADSGGTWSKAVVPTGDTEFEQIAAGRPPYVPDLAATLLGLLESTDGGRSWTHVAGPPTRLTSVDGVSFEAGSWSGELWAGNPDGTGWRRIARFPGGVESVAGSVVATTGGPVPDHPGPLHGREVTRVVSTGYGYFAAAARGAVYFSRGGAEWVLAYQG